MPGEIGAAFVGPKTDVLMLGTGEGTNAGRAERADVMYFRESMAEGEGFSALQGAVLPAGAKEVARSEKPLGLGEVILHGMERASVCHAERVGRIHTMVNGKAVGIMSPGDLMKLQFEILELTIEQELTGKVVDKSGQGVQTLFRNQT